EPRRDLREERVVLGVAQDRPPRLPRRAKQLASVAKLRPFPHRALEPQPTERYAEIRDRRHGPVAVAKQVRDHLLHTTELRLDPRRRVRRSERTDRLGTERVR